VREHVIDGPEDRGGHGADRLSWSAPGFEAQELRPAVAVFGVLGRPRALDERGLQPWVALAQSGALALAGALVLTGAEARPGDQMTVRIKAGHVHADLRKHAHGRQFLDPGDRVDEIDPVGKSGLVGRSLR